MGEDYDKVVETVRQLVALGATRVRIGDFEVELGPRPVTIVDLPSEPEENGLDDRKRWEEEQYFSSGPVSPAQLRRALGGRG